MGCFPGIGENVFLPLPLPPDTRAGTVRSAQPPILRARLGAATILAVVGYSWNKRGDLLDGVWTRD
jgi:hypothetical protein